MTEGQTLLDRCLLLPSDFVARKVFADWLDENGEPELAIAMREDRAERVLVMVRNIAHDLSRYACLRMLWAVVVVMIPRNELMWNRLHDQDTQEVEAVSIHAELSVGEQPAPNYRRGIFARLFKWW